MVRHGSTRVVLLIGRWALKLPSLYSWPHFLRGLLCNMQEAMFSATGWPELCPVVLSIPGGWLVVMPRAHPISREEFFSMDYESFVQRPDHVVPVERKLDSFGMLDGRLVAVDYGGGE